MKLEQQKQDYDLSKNSIEIVDKKKKEIKYIGSQRPIPGLTLFSYNTSTGEIKKAPMKSTAILVRNGVSFKKEVLIEKDCIYLQALNRKNLIKKIQKL